MADDRDWTDLELAAAVKTYLEMLRLDLGNQPYSKSHFRRQLLGDVLSIRTESALEFRMQNISAVLEEMLLPTIQGYPPASNIGTSVKQRIKRILSDIADITSLTRQETTLQSLGIGLDQIMGVKAVFKPLTSYVLCFGSRGTIHDAGYFRLPAGIARRAQERPYVIAVGGGRQVQSQFEGRVLNLARVSLLYGPTDVLLDDQDEIEQLRPWPVAIALHDVWEFTQAPHLVDDLQFADRSLLSGAQDGVVRPEEQVAKLESALRDLPLRLVGLPLPRNWIEVKRPTLVGKKLPVRLQADEGKAVWKIQKELERCPRIGLAAKQLNKSKSGKLTCQSCGFQHIDWGMFDAHHPTPLAAGVRTTLPEHLVILCPTCHRRAHSKSNLDPYSLRELQEWYQAGRP